MQDDEIKLRKLNEQINEAENGGNKETLKGFLAPRFAFRRANGVLNDRAEALAQVAAGGDRKLHIESVALYGERALVTCVVTMTTGDGVKQFHNLRLFVRHAVAATEGQAQEEKTWKLLGWANEEIPSTVL